MSRQHLEQNMLDMICEQQIKLGYRREVVRLYYPKTSLMRFFESDFTGEQFLWQLELFCREFSEKIGSVTVSHQGERYCFCYSPEVGEYVHTHLEGTEFIREFIETISQHGTQFSDLLKVFEKYSRHVKVLQMQEEDFDYVVYFEDGIPDSYRYCITDEGCHLIYHRFTEEDYRDLK